MRLAAGAGAGRAAVGHRVAEGPAERAHNSRKYKSSRSSGDVIPEETAAQMAEARGFEPRMAAKPNRISSPFTAGKATASSPRLTQSAQVSVVAPCKAAEPVTACRKACWPINGPSRTPLRTGPPHARERIRRPLVTHP